jgi:four helix bundle protein
MPDANVIRVHTQLEVYQQSFKSAMKLFEISKSFPPEEKYSLTDQVRRSSRSVSSQIAEAWRKRRYPAAFVSKLNDAEGEAAETQVWIQYAVDCKYMDAVVGRELYASYDRMLATLVGMINHKDQWVLRGK